MFMFTKFIYSLYNGLLSGADRIYMFQVGFTCFYD